MPTPLVRSNITKRASYYVYANLNGVGNIGGARTLITAWSDVTNLPSFSESISSGASDLTVTMARAYGQMGEQYEGLGGFDPGVSEGYLLEVWVSDRWTMESATAASQGVCIYRGTIEDWWHDGTGMLTVTAMGGARLAAQTDILGPLNIGGGSSNMQTFVGTYLPALTWDTNNQSSSVDRPPPMPVVEKTFALDVLQTSAKAAGKDWAAWIDRDWHVRYVKFTRGFTPAAGFVLHTLAVGAEVLGEGLKLQKSNLHRAKRVYVIFQGGVSAPADSGTFDANDHRAVYVNIPEITSQADADATATALLADYDRLLLKAEFRVSGDAYPIETLRLGDIVALQVPRTAGTNSSQGYNDFNVAYLPIVGIRYEFDSVVVQLDDPQPSGVRALAAAINSAQEMDNRLTPMLLKRDNSTTLSAPQGIAAAGDSAGVAGRITITNQSDLGARSSGVGQILTTGSTPLDSVGFMKVVVGTTTYKVPLFPAAAT